MRSSTVLQFIFISKLLFFYITLKKIKGKVRLNMTNCFKKKKLDNKGRRTLRIPFTAALIWARYRWINQLLAELGALCEQFLLSDELALDKAMADSLATDATKQPQYTALNGNAMQINCHKCQNVIVHGTEIQLQTAVTKCAYSRICTRKLCLWQGLRCGRMNKTYRKVAYSFVNIMTRR